MQKRFAFLSVALTVGAAVLGAVACEDAIESTFPELEDSGGVEDSGPGFFTGDASDKEPTEPVECKASIPATFSPTWKPPVKAAVCELADLGTYYDACVDISDVDAGAASCAAWKQDHGECAACLEPADNNGPIQFFHERLYYGLNVAGCLALLRDELEDGACPSKYSASIECQRASCDGCLLEEGASYDDFRSCQKEARSTGCKSYEAAVGSTCGGGLASPDGGAAECFPVKDEGERSHFVRVEGIFCGK